MVRVTTSPAFLRACAASRKLHCSRLCALMASITSPGLRVPILERGEEREGEGARRRGERGRERGREREREREREGEREGGREGEKRRGMKRERGGGGG